MQEKKMYKLLVYSHFISDLITKLRIKEKWSTYSN